MLRNVLMLVCAGTLMSACAGKVEPLTTTSALTVVDNGSLPAPTMSDQAYAARPYAVGPYDKMVIDVYGMEGMMAREVTVDAGGNISFPLVGSFTVAGLTPAQIETEMTRRLTQSYVKNPRVSVNLEEVNSQLVSIDGQVTTPGLYPVIDRMSLMDAVARAEGLTEFAKLDDVVIFREANGERYAALYNLGAIRRGVYGDPQVYAGDQIIVGESRARRIFRDVLATAPLLTAPIIAVLQNSN